MCSNVAIPGGGYGQGQRFNAGLFLALKKGQNNFYFVYNDHVEMYNTYYKI